MKIAGQTVFQRRGQSLNVYQAQEKNEQKRYENIVSKSRAQRHRHSLRAESAVKHDPAKHSLKLSNVIFAGRPPLN